MCDFASFWVSDRGGKLRVLRADWRSHSLAMTMHGIAVTEREEWSEAEWTGDEERCLKVRHTESASAMALKAAVLGAYPTRADLLLAHAGDVMGWVADPHGNITSLPATLPEGITLYGLHSVTSLPATLPEGITLGDLHSVTSLPATLPEGITLGALPSLTSLPATLPEGITLGDLISVTSLPATLPEGITLGGLTGEAARQWRARKVVA